MRYAYFPGCSLHSTAKEYEHSTQAVCRAFGVELVEIPDWNCCGATSAHSLNHDLSVALPARNLGIAEKMGLDVVAPCAACYNRMRSAEHSMKEDAALRERVNSVLANPYSGGVSVFPLVHILTSLDAEALSAAVKTPLEGLKVACYYGCLMVRPPKVLGFDDAEDPQSLDNIMRAIGAEPVDWHYKTECCGGSFSLTRSDLVEKLCFDILSRAKDAGASLVATACPLCQANLDMRQAGAEAEFGRKLGLPIVYFTELMAVAMDLPSAKGTFGSHMIDPSPTLAGVGTKQEECSESG